MPEMAGLLDAAEPHLRVFLMVAATTLGRPEAVLALTKFQCDFERRLIHMNPPGRRQTKKRRPTVPMTGTIRPWLESAEGNIVQYKGRPIKSIKKAFRNARSATRWRPNYGRAASRPGRSLGC